MDKLTKTIYGEAKKRLNGKSVTLIQDEFSAKYNDSVIASCVSDGKKFCHPLRQKPIIKRVSCLELAIDGIKKGEQKFGCKVKSFVSENEAKIKIMREGLQEKLVTCNI